MPSNEPYQQTLSEVTLNSITLTRQQAVGRALSADRSESHRLERWSRTKSASGSRILCPLDLEHPATSADHNSMNRIPIYKQLVKLTSV